MNIIAVDDERLALNALTEAIRQAAPGAQTDAFQRQEELLNFARTSPCDVAFLDIRMRGMSGLELARRLKDMQPYVNIIFVTGHDDYALEAVNMRASGYVLKPVTKEKIEAELADLRRPVERPSANALYVQCFGNFEVFANGAPLAFRHSKTKELLAYLVDRQGANCTMGELTSVLYEHKPDSESRRSQLRNLISDLRTVLKAAGFEDAVIKGHNVVAVNPGAMDCDYYDFLKALPSGINRYHGEYMRQYSWAEVTTAALPRK